MFISFYYTLIIILICFHFHHILYKIKYTSYQYFVYFMEVILRFYFKYVLYISKYDMKCGHDLYFIFIFFYSMWTLISIYEPDEEPISDLIPNIWLINDAKCWYPLNFHMSTIKSLTKSQANPDPKN